MNPKFLKNKLEIEPSKHLKEVVLRRIGKERQKQILRKKLFYFSGFAFSTAGLFAAVGFFGRNIIVSDFWSIVSLAFTDMQIVVGFWKEFVLSLAETFPFEALAAILMPVFLLLIFAKKYSECSEQKLTKLRFKF